MTDNIGEVNQDNGDNETRKHLFYPIIVDADTGELRKDDHENYDNKPNVSETLENSPGFKNPLIFI